MTKIKGIDISYHQGTVDFKKVAADDIKFVILREGYRKTIDPKFLEYVEGCKKNNLPIMVYHFIYLNGATIEENAKATVANMKKAGLDPVNTWIAADLEYDTWVKMKVKCTKEQCTEYTKQYLNKLKALGCKKLMIYMNDDYYDHYYDLKLVQQYPLWFANPGRGAAHGCVLYQTKAAKISGINGLTDIDWLYDESMIKQTKAQDKKEEKAETSTKLKPTAEDILNVMRGWIGMSRAKGTHKPIIDLYNSYTPRARGYKVTYTDSYCDTTVSAAFIKLNAVSLIGGTECSVERHIDIFKKADIWEEKGSITPKPGYLICYNWDDKTQPNDGPADHIGIVESVANNKIVAIEGNIKGNVGRRVISVGNGQIRGYAKPKYAKSAGTSVSTSQKETNKKEQPAKSYDKTKAKTYTTTANLNLRGGPSITNKIITVIPKGKKVFCNGYYEDKWYYVEYDGKKGFCSNKYLK